MTRLKILSLKLNKKMSLHNPLVLLMIPVSLGIIFYAQRKRISPGLRYSCGDLLSGLKPSWKINLSRNLFYLRMLAVSLIIIAIARPQSPLPDSRIETEGIDIVLALDSSTSMLAQDYKVYGQPQSRIEVIRNVVKDFIKARSNDRISIISFAARAYIVCPLTLDYPWLIENLSRVKPGVIEDGTAIGSGITCALNRIKDTKAKSKIIILLTDGGNNAGNISPLTAAQAAKALNIKIYTVGAGSKGLVAYPVYDQAGDLLGYQQAQSDLDEDLLQKIAATTGGKYYRAADTDSLRNVYKDIDSLEKSPIQDKGYQEYNELFSLFLLPGLLLLILEIILNQAVLRRIP